MENQEIIKQLSWSNIDLFLQCQRCFYNQLLFGIKRPTVDPESFKLSKTIDEKLKKEMNFFRGWKPHPTIMAKNKIEAIPFENACVTKWKESNYGKGGIRYHDKNLALTFCGAIDDVWINEDDALIIVEYKTTSTSLGETIEKNPWYKNFKRQISFYAWLFKMNGYKVHNNGYFVYCNGHKESKSFLSFNNCLEFEVTCSPCTIDYSDVEEIIKHASDCLKHPNAPKSSINCMFCKYHEKLQNSNYHNNLTIKEHQGYKTKIVNKIYYKDENVT